MGLSSVVATGASGAMPPLEAFGKREVMSNVVVSPGGTHFAALQWVNGKEILAVYALAPTDPADQRKLLNLDSNKRIEERFRSLSWLNDETLGIVFEFESMRFGSPALETRLIGVARDLSDFTTIPRPIKSEIYQSQLQHRILDHMDGDPVHILMALDREGRGQDLSVYEVNISNGRTMIKTRGESDVAEYWADQTGAVRLRLVYPQGFIRLEYRTPDNSKWLLLQQVERGEGFDFWPLSFGADPNHLVVSRIGSSGFDEIRTLDLTINEFVGEPISRPGVDVSEVVLDRYTRAVTGYRVGEDVPKIHYTDVDLKELQSAVDGILKGTQNSIVSYDRKRVKIVVRAGGPDTPGAYYLFQRDIGKVSKISDRGPIALAPSDLGETRRISYTARDGVQIPAYLTTPRKGKAPWPTVIVPHGGPTSRDHIEWDYWVQFLASRGYAVLQPQFRGSSGFGHDFQVAGYGQWGMLMQDDVSDGARAMITNGTARKGAMCIVGGSYGGYVALMGTVVTPDLFQCAVSFAGVTDIRRMIKEGKRYKFATFNPPNVGRFTGDANQLHDTSPINNIEAIKVPILLVHGDKDLSVHDSHSRFMAKALKKAGKPYKFLLLEDGNHYLDLERHRIQFLKELEAFLDEHTGR